MESLLSHTELEFIQSHHPIFLACSGGRDSMALAHALIENNIPFEILHCNFQLRGDDSDKDEKFITDFCQKNHIPFSIKKFNTKQLASQNKNSIELEARNLRYAFFDEKTASHPKPLVLTAHHLDDHVETILINLMTGSGIDGLKGIPKLRSNKYYRPLLSITRNQIDNYISQVQLEYREDLTNRDTQILRNRIRHQILPMLLEINPQLHDSLTFLASDARSYSDYLQQLAEPFLEEFKENNQVDLSPIIDHRLLKDILYFIFKSHQPNRRQIEDLASSLSSDETKKIQIGNLNIAVKYGKLWDSQNITPFKSYMIHDINELLKSDFLRMVIINKPDEYDSHTLYIDIEKLDFPLMIRNLRNGDIIKPFGMKGKSKKVSDLLQEFKLNTLEKQTIPIIQDKNGEVIWVGHYQIADRVKITENSHQILKINKKE